MKFDDLSNLTDGALVNRFQSTDSEEMRERVFVEIYGRYQRKVEAWAEAACRQGMLSESYTDDVIDAVFFGRLKPEGKRVGLLRFRQECSLEVYIRTVTKSCILDQVRKGPTKSLDETVETRGELVEPQDEIEDYRTWVPVSPDKAAIRKQRDEIIKAALDAVGQGRGKDSWKDAYILKAYYWEGKTDREIGQEEDLKMEEDAVRARRHRAHEKLRKILKQEFGIENLDDIL